MKLLNIHPVMPHDVKGRTCLSQTLTIQNHVLSPCPGLGVQGRREHFARQGYIEKSSKTLFKWTDRYLTHFPGCTCVSYPGNYLTPSLMDLETGVKTANISHPDN